MQVITLDWWLACDLTSQSLVTHLQNCFLGEGACAQNKTDGSNKFPHVGSAIEFKYNQQSKCLKLLSPSVLFNGFQYMQVNSLLM